MPGLRFVKAGKLVDWDRLELHAAITASYSRSDTSHDCIGGGGITTWWCPTAIDKNVGIAMAARMDSGAGPIPVGTHATLVIEDLGIDEDVSYGSFLTSIDLVLRFSGFRLYSFGSFWRLQWDAIDWLIDGSVHTSYPGGQLDSPRMAPTGIPLLGIPAQIGAVGSFSPEPNLGILAGQTSVTSSTISAQGTATGGWRFREGAGDDWVALPALIDLLGFPSLSCPCTGPTSGPTGETTYSLSANASSTYSMTCTYRGRIECGICPDGQPASTPAQWDVWDTEATWTKTGGEVMALPNLETKVNRLNPEGYAQMVYRGGLPEARRTASVACRDFVADTGTSSNHDDSPFPRTAAILSVVGQTEHPLELPLDRDILAPASAGGLKYYGKATAFVVVSPGACPLGVGGDGQNVPPCFDIYNIAFLWTATTGFPGHVDSYYDFNQLAGYLHHSDGIARYVDYWSCGLWSCFDWFPPEEDGAIKPYEWPLFGDRANPSDYWFPARQQWAYHPALPASERRKTRLDLVSDLLSRGVYGAIANGVIGQASSFWGISRFKAQAQTPATKTLTQSETTGWTFTGCTPSFGASAIALSSLAATAVASYDLGEFATDPRMAVHLAKSFAVNWSGAIIASAKVELVGIDGERVTLTSTTGTHAWPVDNDGLKYAGSWGQDYGMGFTALDIGADDLASGISVAEMSNVERAYALALLRGFTADKLEFTFTKGPGLGNITLNYPSFVPSPDRPTLVTETGMWQAVLWPSGPGLRVGMWSFWNYSTDTWQETPDLYAFGGKPSALDWLGARRLIFDGIASSSGLDSELATLWDTTEGTARLDSAYNTLFLLAQGSGVKIVGLMVNAYAELPPLACFPRPKRDADLAETDDYACHAWSMASEPKRYVNAESPMHLFPASGSPWTSAETGIPAHWSITRHLHAVDNTEGATFKIKEGDKTYATVSPWHGYVAALFPGSGATDVDELQTATGEHAMVYLRDGDVVARFAPSTGVDYAVETQITKGEDFAGGWDRPRIGIDARLRLYVVAYHTDQGIDDPLSSGLYGFISDDNARSWGPISAGSFAPEAISVSATMGMVRAANDGPLLRIRFIPDSGTTGVGTFQSEWKPNPDASWSTATTLVDEAGANLRSAGYAFGFDHASESADRWSLSFVPEGGSDPVSYYCADHGLTWRLES